MRAEASISWRASTGPQNCARARNTSAALVAGCAFPGLFSAGRRVPARGSGGGEGILSVSARGRPWLFGQRGGGGGRWSVRASRIAPVVTGPRREYGLRLLVLERGARGERRCWGGFLSVSARRRPWLFRRHGGVGGRWSVRASRIAPAVTGTVTFEVDGIRWQAPVSGSASESGTGSAPASASAPAPAPASVSGSASDSGAGLAPGLAPVPGSAPASDSVSVSASASVLGVGPVGGVADLLRWPSFAL